MPTKTPAPVRATDLDIDLAMLTDGVSDAGLDVLDAIYDARVNLAEFRHLLKFAQQRIEAGAHPFDVREQVATDLIDIANLFTKAARQLGGIYATETTPEADQ